MAVTDYAFPRQAGVKMRGANLCGNPNAGLNGDWPGTPGDMYTIGYNWPWSTWLQPQVDRVYAHGGNCIRLITSAPLLVGDASHHGTMPWLGTISYATLETRLTQLAQYLEARGMYFYACAAESFELVDANLSSTNLLNHITAYVDIVSNFPNCLSIDVCQEWDGYGTSGHVVADNLAAIISTAKAARVYSHIPVTCSMFATDVTATAITRPAFLQARNAGIDYFCLHLYYPFAPSHLDALYGNAWGLPVFHGEAGVDLNGNFANGPADGTSQGKRATWWGNFVSLLSRHENQGGCQWAITDQATSPLDGNRWGLYSGTQNGSSVFTDPRTEAVNGFEDLPTTIQPKEASDAGPELATPPSVTVGTTSASLTWSAAQVDSGTVTYTPQYIQTTSTGVPLPTDSWHDGTPTTGLSGTLTGLTASTPYAFRLKLVV